MRAAPAVTVAAVRKKALRLMRREENWGNGSSEVRFDGGQAEAGDCGSAGHNSIDEPAIEACRCSLPGYLLCD